MIPVNEIYETLKAIANKNDGSFSPSDFNYYAPMASTDIFNWYFGNPKQYGQRALPRVAYGKTTIINEVLKHLLVIDDPLVLTLGLSTTPTDKAHIISISCDSAAYIERLENDKYETRKRSRIFPATTEYPIYRERATSLEFYPSILTSVKINYMKYPTKPVWSYDIVSNRPVYKSAGSVDFDWPESERMNIITRMLSYLGIQIREGDLTQYAEQKQQTTS